MDKQQRSSLNSHTQFIPAETGWLALFEEETKDGIRVHADPVIAWRLSTQATNEGRHGVSHGQAVIGASPWLDKAEQEESSHFFALVHEEQLAPEFLEELTHNSHHSREDILIQAKNNHAARLEGHATWRRQHRADKQEKGATSPLRLFSI